MVSGDLLMAYMPKWKRSSSSESALSLTLNNTLHIILHLLLLFAYKNNTTTNTHFLNTPYLRYRTQPCDIM
jgi:hypothetical protein